MQMHEVAILNRSTVIADADVERIVAALQIQLDRDFAPAWGVGAELSFVPATAATGWEGKWNIALIDTGAQAGPLGYHDLTPEGLPIGKVSVADDLKWGHHPSVTVSHELLELLGDPHTHLLVQEPAPPGSYTFWAYELCDAVQQDELGYEIDGVVVSDFVLPRYFHPGLTTGRFDFQGHLPAAFSLAPGCYKTVLEVPGGWCTYKVAPDGQPARVAPAEDPTRPGGGTRKDRRARPRPDWKKSAA